MLATENAVNAAKLVVRHFSRSQRKRCSMTLREKTQCMWFEGCATKLAPDQGKVFFIRGRMYRVCDTHAEQEERERNTPTLLPAEAQSLFAPEESEYLALNGQLSQRQQEEEAARLAAERHQEWQEKLRQTREALEQFAPKSDWEQLAPEILAQAACYRTSQHPSPMPPAALVCVKGPAGLEVVPACANHRRDLELFEQSQSFDWKTCTDVLQDLLDRRAKRYAYVTVYLKDRSKGQDPDPKKVEEMLQQLTPEQIQDIEDLA